MKIRQNLQRVDWGATGLLLLFVVAAFLLLTVVTKVADGSGLSEEIQAFNARPYVLILQNGARFYCEKHAVDYAPVFQVCGQHYNGKQYSVFYLSPSASWAER